MRAGSFPCVGHDRSGLTRQGDTDATLIETNKKEALAPRAVTRPASAPVRSSDYAASRDVQVVEIHHRSGRLHHGVGDLGPELCCSTAVHAWWSGSGDRGHDGRGDAKVAIDLSSGVENNSYSPCVQRLTHRPEYFNNRQHSK